jgi:DNA gyrase subunit A
MGRATVGVKGIELREGDQVVGLAVSDPNADQVLAITAHGYGKRTPIDQFREQKRGGIGITLIDTGERNGDCVGLRLVNESQELMLISDKGQTLRTRVAEIKETQSRGAMGVRVMTLEEGERVVAFERLAESEQGAEMLAMGGEETTPTPGTGSTEGSGGDGGGSPPPPPAGDA